MPSNHNEYSLSGFERTINSIVQRIFYYRLIFVGASIIGIIVINFYLWNFSFPEEKLKNVATAFTCGSIIVGIFYSIINYEVNHTKLKRDALISKKALSFATAFEWHKDTIVNHLKTTKTLYDQHKHLIDQNKSIEFSELLESDETGRFALVSIFNFLECIALGVEEDILDEDFIKGFFGTLIITYTADYEFYINYRRKKHHSPKSWINFTTLASKWK